MRILLVNGAVSETCLSGFNLTVLTDAYRYRGHVAAPNIPNLHDLDAVVIDLGTLPVSPSQGELFDRSLADLLDGGGILVCFASNDADFASLPVTVNVRERVVGSRLTIVPETPFTSALERFQDDLKYECTFNRPEKNEFRPLATTLDGWPVALSAFNGRLVVLPRSRRMDNLTSHLFTTVLPDRAPARFVTRQTAQRENAPEWAANIVVPGAAQLATEIGALEERIRGLEEERLGLNDRHESLSAYSELLWARGKDHLEPLVRDVLNILGVHVEGEGLIDAVYRGDGGPLFIEIEGSDGNIDVQKGRQLLHYIADSEDVLTKGAIIGNPFRLEPLQNRPPNPQWQVFSVPLTQLAVKQGWPLVTTAELFELLCRHLDGEAVTEELRRKLGLVRD